jgi:cytochrome c peroxidase
MKRSWRTKILFLAGALALVAALLWFKNHDMTGTNTKPLTRNTSPLSDEEFKAAVAAMRLASSDNKPAPSNEHDDQRLVELGRSLFFDAGFSANGQISCATCHQPDKAFTDGKATAEGLAKTAMNAPTLVNAAGGAWFFWNGRADSLEAQAMGPVENPKEHGFSRIKVADRLNEVYKSEYESIFGPLPKVLPKTSPETFPAKDAAIPPAQPPQISDAVAAYALATLGSPILLKSILRDAQSKSTQPVAILKEISAATANSTSIKTLSQDTDAPETDAINIVFANYARAIAAFERTIVADNAPFDRFAERLSTKNKPEDAYVDGFQAEHLRGLRLFTGRGQCTLCHQGPLFTDQQFHNIGLPTLTSETIDLGRAQGMIMARESLFNCRGKYLTQKKLTESCRELGYLESENAESVGAFKTPTLRQLGETAPFGHDGRFPRLRDVLEHYNYLAVPPAVGHTEESLVPLRMSSQELDDLEAFLLSLNGKLSFFKG